MLTKEIRHKIKEEKEKEILEKHPEIKKLIQKKLKMKFIMK